MFTIIFSFAVACFFSVLLLWLKKWHLNWSADFNDSPQKIHVGVIPRIGGIAIFLGFLFGSILKYISHGEIGIFLLITILASSPIFFAGLCEDFTKRINFKWRLLFSLISGLLFVNFFSIYSISIDVTFIDLFLQISWVSIIFLSFAIAGLCNSYNIIDGINGLASMVGILCLFAILYVGVKVNDALIINFCLIGIGSVFGFFIWNYPRGLIFLGDGGAYLLGFWIASCVILLVVRNPNVSPWFALLVNAYPVFETLFTIWRRSVHRNRKVMMPDGAHFHSLIYRRIMRWAGPTGNAEPHYLNNAKTSPYLWFLSSIGLIPAVLFWNSTLLLIISSILFTFLYIYFYRKIVSLRKQPRLFLH